MSLFNVLAVITIVCGLFGIWLFFSSYNITSPDGLSGFIRGILGLVLVVISIITAIAAYFSAPDLVIHKSWMLTFLVGWLVINLMSIVWIHFAQKTNEVNDASSSQLELDDGTVLEFNSTDEALDAIEQWAEEKTQ